ncbi:hypothetical protein [Absidia glauca]|uniref:Conserved oligomeric Golgi complex subunit 1 n=1 Tax=Absidia glauca TaxID=4829 RepID=A0A168S2T9_ABSGL|nr:hypothetical protein [Absidia glauca]
MSTRLDHSSSTPSPPPVPKKDDDPDTYLAEASVAEVRAFEKRTRQNVETRKKELRSMVGEQYVDLIAAADTIIDMEKKANLIQQKLERMQGACDVHAIQRQAAQIHQSEEKEHSSQDQKQQQLYILASLIKSLADVPEQIWHALESHQHLQAGCLYTLAQKVHEYLETEDSFMVDIDVAFPVIQRQWDAISFFRPQIIQKSIQHLRLCVLEPEVSMHIGTAGNIYAYTYDWYSLQDVAKVLVGLILMDGMTTKATLELVLEMRTKAINDLIQQSINKENADLPDQRLSRLLREIALTIQRTLVHIHSIYLSAPSNQSLLTLYASQLQTSFTIPTHTKSSSPADNNSHHRRISISGSSSAGAAAARLFSPSTNAHLLIRYLPQSIQQFTPRLDTGLDTTLTDQTITDLTQRWLENIKQQMDTHLGTILHPITTTHKLLELRTRVWDLLHHDEYKGGRTLWLKICQELLGGQVSSIYDTMFRSSFNRHARIIIDTGCKLIGDQPNQEIWPLISDHLQGYATKNGFELAPKIWSNGESRPGGHYQVSVFSLPTLSSTSAISSFNKALTEAATEQTPDAMAIKDYFQKQCEQANEHYITGLYDLLTKLKASDEKNKAIELAMWTGRVARLISEESKELSRALAFPLATGREDDQREEDLFALKSGSGKDPTYARLQDQFMGIYRASHQPWMEATCRRFGQQLSSVLQSTPWDDRCPAIAVWENMADGDKDMILLPTMATNATQRVLFGVCEAIQGIQSTRLEKVVLHTLCHDLHETLVQTLDTFLADDALVISEKGALQLMFDLYFLNRVVNQADAASSLTSSLKAKIDPINWAVFEPYYDDNVELFYLRQTLLLGVLVRPNSGTFERTRKAMAGNQQHYNVLPLAPQAQRFTLLPIGSSIRIR